MKTTLTLLFILVLCTGCTTGAFWSDFREDDLRENESDQGPWGGKREMYWKADGGHGFTRSEVIAYAEDNDWELKDTVTIPAERLSNWKNGSQPAFPFTYDGTFEDIDLIHPFKRWITTDVILYRFITGNCAIDAMDEKTWENGYILISKDGRELSVYHFWGE